MPSRRLQRPTRLPPRGRRTTGPRRSRRRSPSRRRGGAAPTRASARGRPRATTPTPKARRNRPKTEPGGSGHVAVPFRVGVMQLTMEPLDDMLATAGELDRNGFDTIWLAEAYPWWRKHGMEARSSTVVSALMARDTERLTIGWGIISPFTRHPVQVAMDARVVQEAAGPGRFILGF